MTDQEPVEVLLDFKELPEDTMCRASRAFYETIKTRRSVRDFSARGFPRSVIENALRAAGTAPSGANMQPWHFVVVENPEVKKRLREAAEHEEREFYNRRAPKEWLDVLAPLGTDANKPFLETAPYLIAVFVKRFISDDKGRDHKTYYPNESVGIATGFLIAALHQAGVATLTHTPSPMKFLNRILGRPDNERPFLLLVTGYPAEGAKVPDISKLDLEETTSFV
ncbi:MAG: nitroreductase family protein [Planctomycetota bacterium]|jgi:nitroreductase